MKIKKYLSEICQKELNNIEEDFDNLEEIRLRINKPLILKFSNKEKVMSHIITTEDLLETLEKITESSRYTYEKQISEGYITLPGGNRVGIVGNAICENDKVINISYISGLNFRIAKQIYNSSNFIEHKILENNKINNTLLVGSPRNRKDNNIKRPYTQNK